jgi:hypothetical protein
MNMPGFTAERSLHRSAVPYQMDWRFVPPGVVASVAQPLTCSGGCLSNCTTYCGNLYPTNVTRWRDCYNNCALTYCCRPGPILA